MRPQTSFKLVAVILALGFSIAAVAQERESEIGREVAIPQHLKDGDEFNVPTHDLITFGLTLFNARFTIQEGAGRPLSKGTGAPLSDPGAALIFPANFDQLSGPDSNSCAVVTTSQWSAAVVIARQKCSCSASDSTASPSITRTAS